MEHWTDAQVTQFVVTMIWVMAGLSAVAVCLVFGAQIWAWISARSGLVAPAALIVAGAVLGAAVGWPLVGLFAGVLVALAYHSRPTVRQAMGDSADYVEGGEPWEVEGDRVSPHGKAEMEIPEEMENAGKLATLAPAQLTELLAQARREEAARALGALIGAGLLVEGGRTRAMTLLFGPPGRKHAAVKGWVDAAEASARAGRPDEVEREAEPRVIPVGRDGHFVEV